MSKLAFPLLFICVLFASCKTQTALEKHVQHFQQHKDYASLEKVVASIELGADTSLVKKILGEPIDMGFDYRYLTDSLGPQGCPVGAVFHIDESGKIDQKWIDEICE